MDNESLLVGAVVGALLVYVYWYYKFMMNIPDGTVDVTSTTSSVSQNSFTHADIAKLPAMKLNWKKGDQAIFMITNTLRDGQLSIAFA